MSHVRLMAGFTPCTVRAPLHVFTALASLQDGDAGLADPAGWLAYTHSPSRSSAQVLAGNHESLMQIETNLREMARALRGTEC